MTGCGNFKRSKFVLAFVEILVAIRAGIMRFRSRCGTSSVNLRYERAIVVAFCVDYKRSKFVLAFVEILVTYRTSVMRFRSRRRTGRGNFGYKLAVCMLDRIAACKGIRTFQAAFATEIISRSFRAGCLLSKIFVRCNSLAEIVRLYAARKAYRGRQNKNQAEHREKNLFHFYSFSFCALPNKNKRTKQEAVCSCRLRKTYGQNTNRQHNYIICLIFVNYRARFLCKSLL